MSKFNPVYCFNFIIKIIILSNHKIMRQFSVCKQLHKFKYIYSLRGEGNGAPLQYSCLENPKDGGAWWAAICGAAQSWT